MKTLLKIIIDFKRFFKISSKHKDVICFLEKKSDMIYFDRFFSDLNKFLKIKVLILTSDENFKLNNKNNYYLSDIIYIGKGICRILYFRLISTKIFFMTTPDLNNSELKKSINKVKYFYIFHSIVSTHMIYNNGAFDNYDYLLTAGPHQSNEIKVNEKKLNLPPKKILKFGYPRILDMSVEFQKKEKLKTTKRKNKKTILIAPTWGASSITDSCIEEIFLNLVKFKNQIIFRPHPKSLEDNYPYIKQLELKFKNKIHFQYNIKDIKFINDVDLLISDWSGFAIEFFLVCKKPILFIDTPTKIRNLNYNDLLIEPLEKSIRNEIGEIITLNEINNLNYIISSTLSKNKEMSTKIKCIYNYEDNLNSTINIIKKILKK